MKGLDMEDNIEEYRRALVELDEGHNKWIETVSNRAFDYGVMAVKNVLFVSGGALLAIPAVVGLTDAFETRLAALAGLSFGVSVALSVLCIYIIHINWLSHYHVAFWEKQLAIKRVWEAHLPKQNWTGLSEDDLKRRIKRNTSMIGWTFVLPHVFGLFAFVSFAYGAFRLYQSVGL